MFAIWVAWVCGVAHAGITVMVLPFQNSASEPEYAPLGLGLQSMITSDLAYADDLVVVERSRLQDVLAELEFQQSKYVDPATAVKIGKAVSATHYVHGSFTVVGANMRLDARLVDIGTQSVVAQADLTGEKDAFFELEKEVVKKFLAGIGAALSPKERADIARIQTADMGALVKYSSGLQLYDDERYEDAIRILEEVAAEDPNFALASMTAAEIQKAALDAALRAQAARAANVVQGFVAHRAGAERDAILVGELQAIAADASREWQDRATANLVLARLAGTFGPYLRRLKDSSDRFALERAGERAYQAAWSELRAQAGAPWYPALSNLSEPWGDPDDGGDVEQFIRTNRARWFGPAKPGVLSDCRYMVPEMDIEEEYAFLWVPHRERLELARQLLEQSRGCVDQYPKEQMQLANEYRGAGLLGSASAVLVQLSKESKDVHLLERVAAQLEEISEEQARVERYPVGSAGRERLLPVDAWAPGSPGFGRGIGGNGTYGANPTSLRAYFDRRIPLFLNGIPTWPATRVMFSVETGPRTAIDEAKALRFRGDEVVDPDWTRPMVFVLGGTPRRDVVAAVTVDYGAGEVPTSGRQPSGASEAHRPAAGILFGLRELATNAVCDPLDPTIRKSVPTTGYGAVIVDGALIIAEVQEKWHPGHSDSCDDNIQDNLEGLDVGRPLASARLTAPTTKLTLEVKGTTATATAGAVKVTAKLPSGPAGFVALYADGPGRVELRDPTMQ